MSELNAVYGQSLLSFPELFRKFKYFNQSPLNNGGYDDKTPYIEKRAVFRDDGSKAKDPNGNWVRTSRKTIWSQERLMPGAFVLFNGLVYRIVSDQAWPRQGGFYVFELEKLVGNAGVNEVKPAANLGQGSFT